MAEVVGQIAYEVTLDTGKMVEGQRRVRAEVEKASGQFDTLRTKLTAVASAVGLYASAMATVKAAKLADDVRMLAVRVQVAAGSIEAGPRPSKSWRPSASEPKVQCLPTRTSSVA